MIILKTTAHACIKKVILIKKLKITTLQSMSKNYLYFKQWVVIENKGHYSNYSNVHEDSKYIYLYNTASKE